VQIVQRQLDKLSALCTFCARACRDIFPRPEPFSTLLHAALKCLANDPTKKNFPSVQLRTSSVWCRSCAALVPIRSCIARTDEKRSSKAKKTTVFATTTVPKLQPTAADRQELPAQAPELQPTAVGSTSLQAPATSKNLPLQCQATAHCSSQFCSSGDTRISIPKCQIYSTLQQINFAAPGTTKSSCKPHPLWTAHRFHCFALQSEPATASQFLHLASNSNTLHNLWHL